MMNPEPESADEAHGAGEPDFTRTDIAIYAHELRGALTVIGGYAELLKRPLEEVDRQAALEGITRAVRRADKLCGAVLSEKRASSLAERSQARVVVRELVEHVVADQRSATGRRIDLSGADVGEVVGDEEALSRVVENLVSNAAKYSPSDKPIDVVLSTRDSAETGRWAAIEVADRGYGIPAEQRERVLEPFERLDRDTKRPGTGLGLTIVRDVVVSHGGTVTLDAREGGGTIFRIELPSAP